MAAVTGPFPGPPRKNVILRAVGVLVLAAAATRLDPAEFHRKDAGKVPTEALLAQLQSEDFVERCEARRELAKREDPALVSSILQILKDRRPRLRSEAVATLGGFGDPSVFDTIVGVLREDPAWEVRVVAAGALGLMHDARATPALLAALAADGRPEVRGQAAVALSQYPGCDAVRGLVAAALRDTADLVQHYAESSVMSLTTGSSDPAGWKRWVDTNCAIPQTEGRSSRLAPPATPPRGKTEPEEPDCEYLAWLAGETPARAGERTGREQAADVASSALVPEETPEERATKASTAVLVAQLQSESFFERFAAREELSKRKDPASLPKLLRLVKDERPGVRAEAVEVLGHFKDASLLETIASVLAGDTEWEVRFSAVNALAAMRDGRAAPLLMATLVKDEWPGVRAQAALALSVYPSCDAARALLAALGDAGPWVAEHAALALRDVASGTDQAAWKRWVETNCPVPETERSRP